MQNVKRRIFIREIREIRGSIPLVAACRAAIPCGHESAVVSVNLWQHSKTAMRSGECLEKTAMPVKVEA
jgi:hypothetical protein